MTLKNKLEQAAEAAGMTVLEYMKKQIQEHRFASTAARVNGVSRQRWYQIHDRALAQEAKRTENES